MKFKHTILKVTLGAGLLLSPTFAQEEGPRSQDITVQATGSFVTSTGKDGVQQSASNTGGFLASYRFFFSRHSGVEFNYGFENNTQTYGVGGSALGVGTRSHEASAAYVLRFQHKWISPFVLAGTGALIFEGKDFVNASTQARATFLYGAGVRFSKHLFMRGEYRGLVYDSPTYNLASFNGFDRVTHRAEPSLGFGFRF